MSRFTKFAQSLNENLGLYVVGAAFITTVITPSLNATRLQRLESKLETSNEMNQVRFEKGELQRQQLQFILSQDISDVKKDIAYVKEDVDQVKRDIDQLKVDMKKMKDEVKKDLAEIKALIVNN
ncbi:hypothetical protein MIR68_004541 [Amoeboaphelidium protococcarum]|nr:hypothetical protein MIR68_004541 [Amoeboaphelidium protococcarum]